MKNYSFLFFLIAIGFVVWLVFAPRPIETEYSEFLNLVNQNQVETAIISPDEIEFTVKDSDEVYVTNQISPESLNSLSTSLQEHGVKFTGKPNQESWVPIFLFILLPFIFLGIIIYFIARGLKSFSKSGGLGALTNLGKSTAKLFNNKNNKIKISFADVAGCDEAKAEVEDIVKFLKNPDHFGRLGGKMPKGALLVGGPGVGKTLLAKAIAGEANVPFFTISGSDFVEMFAGLGASRVRDMFEQGRKNAPCIIFIDELDAIGRKRGRGNLSGHDEREQTLNQILTEMDGFDTTEGVIILAATNRPDVLDPALLRPGRFDRQIVVANPDIKGREEILQVHLKKIVASSDINASIIARGTPGFSGADIANLVNEAALLAAKENKDEVTMLDFERAKDKIMLGAERPMIMNEEDKELTAYHEAGHALVGYYTPGNDPIHKITIIPRGRALGVTHFLPESDRYGLKKSQIKAKLAMMHGGRQAEIKIYGPDSVTTGAGQDIKVASLYARDMVTKYGMSDKVGAIDYSSDEETFLGSQQINNSNISDKKADLIDEEVQAIINEAENQARAVLNEHEKELHAVVKALLKEETLTGEQLEEIIDSV